MTITVPVTSGNITVPVNTPGGVTVPISTPDGIVIKVGTTGPEGPPGPQGGTPVVAVPFAQWPPVNPQPNTLYLRLAP